MAIHETISAFEGELNDYKRKIKQSFITTHKRICKTTVTEIVNGTPIDSGRAVAGWKVSIGSPETDTDPGRKFFNPHIESSVIAEATAVINSINERNTYERVYISNTVPYIQRLENGYSDQAPAGMVKLALQKVRFQMGIGR